MKFKVKDGSENNDDEAADDNDNRGTDVSKVQKDFSCIF